MATYSNQHWLLSHIRNSFISTDDTSMCETVMVSDDLPKHFLRKFQTAMPTAMSSNTKPQALKRNWDAPLPEVSFVCYPGLDESDDEDIDLSAQSFDIQMYPEVGAHRFRSNTAQWLEKMDIAKRKAARTKTVNYDDDEVYPTDSNELFVRKTVVPQPQVEQSKRFEMKSKLALQLENSPKQTQNRFLDFARFDGTSQTGMQTKRINVFLSMLPERERNYPIKICVIATAKIIEVIGLVCYKATLQYPDIPLKSIRYYALYMTEDNDDMEDFPPLDNREPCSKFGFSHLTLAERRPLAPVTRVDYNPAHKSMTSEEDKARLANAAVRSLLGIELNGGTAEESSTGITTAVGDLSDYEERMLSHNDMLEAPMHRTYRLHIVDKRYFKSEVTLGVSSDGIEIDHHKNSKFWNKQKADTFPIDVIAHCELVNRRKSKPKAFFRIWLKAASSKCTGINVGGGDGKTSTIAGNATNVSGAPHSPSSPGHYTNFFPQLTFFSANTASNQQQEHIRFKHYNFEADVTTAEQIVNKLNCILDVRSSELRREFMRERERKSEKSVYKRHLKF